MAMKKKITNVLVYEDDSEFIHDLNDAKSIATQWGVDFSEVTFKILQNTTDFETCMEKLVSNDNEITFALLDVQIGADDKAGMKAITTLRKRFAYKDFPVVMFSKSYSRKHRQDAYDAGATSYVRKFPTREKRINTLAEVLTYWSFRNIRAS